MDDNFQFSQLTPERIVAQYLINMQHGDFGILDEVKTALHQQIAYELIKAGEGQLVADNLVRFKNISYQEILAELIEAGESLLAEELAEHLPDLKL